jgi:hypothetical protein
MKQTISIRSNAYAENVGFIGTKRTDNFPTDWMAKQWLSDMLATGNYKLSKSSRYNLEDVKAHEEAINNVQVGNGAVQHKPKFRIIEE